MCERETSDQRIVRYTQILTPIVPFWHDAIGLFVLLELAALTQTIGTNLMSRKSAMEET